MDFPRGPYSAGHTLTHDAWMQLELGAVRRGGRADRPDGRERRPARVRLMVHGRADADDRLDRPACAGGWGHASRPVRRARRDHRRHDRHLEGLRHPVLPHLLPHDRRAAPCRRRRQARWPVPASRSPSGWPSETAMHFYDAETLRHLANLELHPLGREEGLREALALARRQHCVLFEVRAAIDLVDLCGDTEEATLESALGGFRRRVDVPGAGPGPECARPDSVTRRKKVVVLGGGMAGLTAAWRLSEPGWESRVRVDHRVPARAGDSAARGRAAGGCTAASRSTASTSGSVGTTTPSGSSGSATRSSTAPSPIRSARCGPSTMRCDPAGVIGLAERLDGAGGSGRATCPGTVARRPDRRRTRT